MMKIMSLYINLLVEKKDEIEILKKEFGKLETKKYYN